MEVTQGVIGTEVRAPVAGTAMVRWVGAGMAQMPDWSAEDAIAYQYYANVVVFAAVRAIAQDIAALDFRAGFDVDDKDNYNKNARLAQLLGPEPGSPNEEMSSTTFWEHTIASYLIGGAFCWEIEYAKGKNDVYQLWPLMMQYTRPIPSRDPRFYFSGIEYTARGKSVTFNRDKALYHWKPSMRDIRQPESFLDPAKLSVSVMVMQDRYDYSFLKNDARPAAVIVHEAFATVAARDAWRENFTNTHVGPENAGRIHWVEASEDGAPPKDAFAIQTLGLSQSDAEFIARYDQKLRDVVMATGVPMSRLGDSSERTFSNADKEYEIYRKNVLIPKAKELETFVNRRLAPRVGREFGWFDTRRFEIIERGGKILTTGIPELIKHKVIKFNEARSALGLPPVEGGDRFITDEELGLLQQAAATLIKPDPGIVHTEKDPETLESPKPIAPPPPPEPEPAPDAAQDDDDGEGETAPTGDARGRDQRVKRSALEQRRLNTYKKADRTVLSLEAQFEAKFNALLEKQLKITLDRLEGKRGRKMLAEFSEQRANPVGYNQYKRMDRGGLTGLVKPEAVKTTADLQNIADAGVLPPDDGEWDYFFHATRYDGEVQSIADGGLVAGGGGTGLVFLSKDEIRDRGSGFVVVRVPKGQAEESVDFVEAGLTYRQFTVPGVPAANVVRGIKVVTDSTGFRIREDELAKFALSSPGSAEAASLPAPYQKWFGLEGRAARRDIRAAGAGIFEKGFWERATHDEFVEAYEAVFGAAAANTFESLGVQLTFDIDAPYARDFIEERANQLAWNVTQTTYEGIQAELAEGAAQGEDIPTLAKRIRNLFQQTYRNRAVTVARTEVISAYNGSTLQQAKELGADVVAAHEWIATPGTRTRHTHRDADGQIKLIDAAFTVGGAQLRYPGDPAGPAKEVVNCRCALGLLTPEEARERGLEVRAAKKRSTRANPMGYNQYKHAPAGAGDSDGLTSEQIDSLQYYTQSGSAHINYALRSGSELSADDAAHVANIDASLQPSAAEIQVHRSVDDAAFPGVKLHRASPEDLVGREFGDKAFMSTSLDLTGQAYGGTQVEMIMRVPAGTRLRALGSLSSRPGEQEVLLDRGLKWTVRSATEQGGKWRMEVDITS